MPTLQADDVPGGKPADEAGEGSPKVAGLGAETSEPTVLESWVMDTTLLEQVAEAKSWKLRKMRDEWFMMWYEVGAAKPQVQPLGIRVAEADRLTLGGKIRVEVEEERALLEALGRKPGAMLSPAAGTPSPAVGVPSPLVGTPARKKTVLSKDCKQDREKKTPDSTGAGKAKLVLAVETPRVDPVVTEKVRLTQPINFEEVSRILTAQGKTPTCKECVAYLHNQLGAEVVAEGSEPAEDGYSVVGSGFLIADDKLVGLRVVGIGAVDSSGSRGRYAQVTRVTNARVEVEFEVLVLLDKWRPTNIAKFIEYWMLMEALPLHYMWNFVNEKHLVNKDCLPSKCRANPLTGYMDAIPVSGDFCETFNLIAVVSGNPDKPKNIEYHIDKYNGDSIAFFVFITSLIKKRFFRHGKILVMDNAAIHTGSASRNIERLLWETEVDRRQLNVLVIYLPTRSPELNPIELIFHILSRRIRSFRYQLKAPPGQEVLHKTASALDEISYELILQCYTHCGY